MIKLFEPYVSEQSKENVMRVLNSTQLAEGPEVKAFEEEFAAKFGFEAWQIVTVNSGTSALELAYDIVGIKEGDEVIAPVLTCTATNIPLVRRKANIIFGDVEGHSHLNLSPDHVKRYASHKTKAIVYVHFGGSSDGLEQIQQIADKTRTDLICDAAQALGNDLARSARFTTISLQAIKSLTSGDGGILICRDSRDAVLARKLRWYGYDREEKQRLGDAPLDVAGYKFHMNDIAAAIARGNLSDWDLIFKHRQTINRIYLKRFVRSKYPTLGAVLVPGIWNPQVIGMPFEETKERMEKAGIAIGQYHYPNYKYSIFESAKKHVPEMRRIENHYFILPCHMGMSIKDAEDVAETLWLGSRDVKSFFRME